MGGGTSRHRLKLLVVGAVMYAAHSVRVFTYAENEWSIWNFFTLPGVLFLGASNTVA
jgi:hypothetical protein